RRSDAKRLGGLEVQGHLNLRGLLNRQLTRLIMPEPQGTSCGTVRPSIRCVMGRWGRKMKVLSDPACKQCGGRMEMGADISPRSRGPGLRAFVGSECGTVESVQIDPDNHFGPNHPTYHGKRC